MLIKKIIYTLFPSQCLLCREISPQLPLCEFCIEKLPWNISCCYQCGLPIEAEVLSKICGVCITNALHYDQTTALFRYKPPIPQFITRLKFGRQLLYAHLFGNLLADKILKTRTHNTLPECIIAIPLHRKRLRERGFNQALEIAKPIQKKLNIPIALDYSIRNKYTEPQTSLHANQRKQNVKNAFALKRNIALKHIAILDDVVTTGNTVNEMAKLLRLHGVEKIEVWCCARV